MKRGLAVSSVAALLLIVLPPVAEAQEAIGGRMRVLVPSLEGVDRSTERFGQRLADRLRREIDGMTTHVSVEPRQVRDALRQLGVREEDVDCLGWRQLAPRINAGLVLCGRVGTGNEVTASFISADEGATFDVPAFVAQNEAEAATRVVAAFGEFIAQIEAAYVCAESIQMEAWSEAEQRCRRAVGLNPRLVSAQYHLASALIRLDRVEEALDGYERVVELEPVHVEALLGAGVAASRLGRQELSMEYLDRYLELNPDDEQVLLSVATRLANGGDAQGALRLVESALERGDAAASTYRYAGHFAMAAGLRLQESGPAADVPREDVFRLLQSALDHYAEAERRGAEPDATVLRSSMVALSRLGRTDEAIAMGERATQEAPDSVANWSTYADVLRDGGRHADALAALDRVAALDPDFPRVGARRAMLLIELGRPQDAAAAARQSIDREEIDASAIESIAQTFVVAATRRPQTPDGRREAIANLEAARLIGRSERTIGMINHVHGFLLMQEGETIAQPNTRQSAEASLSVFRMALNLLQSADGYPDQAENRRQAIERTQRFIEIQEIILRR